jgi:hypothetical protein
MWFISSDETQAARFKPVREPENDAFWRGGVLTLGARSRQLLRSVSFEPSMGVWTKRDQLHWPRHLNSFSPFSSFTILTKADNSFGRRTWPRVWSCIHDPVRSCWVDVYPSAFDQPGVEDVTFLLHSFRRSRGILTPNPARRI